MTLKEMLKEKLKDKDNVTLDDIIIDSPNFEHNVDIFKIEEDQTDKIMTKIDPENNNDDLMITDSMYVLISSNPAEKIVTGEQVFKHLERAYPGLVVQDRAYFYSNKTKVELGTDTNSVLRNKTIDPTKADDIDKGNVKTVPKRSIKLNHMKQKVEKETLHCD